MPSPGRGASKMPLSTSLNSSSGLPCASSSFRKSPSLNCQAATSFTKVKWPAQAGSNSTRLPTRLDSLRKVIAQVFSRSALENSQVPTMVRGTAGGGGSVTAGSGMLTGGSAGCAASGAAQAASRIRARGRLRIIPAKYHARFCGGQGVSGIGDNKGLPAAQARRLSTTSCSIFWRVKTVAEPRCGNRVTLSSSRYSLGTSGSLTNTSRPAA